MSKNTNVVEPQVTDVVEDSSPPKVNGRQELENALAASEKSINELAAKMVGLLEQKEQIQAQLEPLRKQRDSEMGVFVALKFALEKTKE